MALTPRRAIAYRSTLYTQHCFEGILNIMLVELQKAQVERITFQNEENGYTIARVKVKGRQGLVTIVGNLPGLSVGEILNVKGEWHQHPRFGEQLKVLSYESLIPATAAGIEKYLGSGLIKGIGPVMAKRLVSRFGVETLNVIEDHIERLQEVDGIGEKRIEMIRSAWDEQKEIRDVMVFLQGHGVSPAYATRIFRQYGREAVHIVRDNPYRLAEDVFGIGFLTADKIAAKLGVSKESPMRAEAGIQYVLHQLADEGHVFFPLEPLIEECRKILDLEGDVIRQAAGGAAQRKKIVIDSSGDRDPKTYNVYLAALYASEVGLARRLLTLVAQPKQLPLMNREDAIKEVQKGLKIALSENQLQAVREALERKVMVITGGPGTGKTTIINSIIRLYGRTGQKILLAAPTGRAAKRIFEATKHDARTIHRLLEFSPKDGRFKKNEDEPLDADLVVVDEVSMVDTVLMFQLLKAVPPGATLILVGDVDQLPSVGPGNVLKDIIDSGCIPVVRLTQIFRQSETSTIVVNAHRINSGEMPISRRAGQTKSDFHFIEVDQPEKALETIVGLCRDRLPKAFGYDAFSDIQVLTPMHKGTIGATNLNAELQKTLNPSTQSVNRAGRTFKTGDKVMQMRNNYDKDVFNGDIGRIVRINAEERDVLVNFDGKVVTYDFNDLDELVLAYATSVHKAQGSEFPAIVMPVMVQHFILLQRNLLYTGITRGKKLVVLVGTKKALAIAIRNNKPKLRFTLLKERLQKALSE
jgi:exodeoxyribonuclease V alpha subunit